MLSGSLYRFETVSKVQTGPSQKYGQSDTDAPSFQLDEDAVCADCGYLLHGLTHSTCPECGRSFVPGNETTYLRLSERGYFQGWPYSPGIWSCATAACLTSGYLWVSSIPGGVNATFPPVMSAILLSVVGIAGAGCVLDYGLRLLNLVRRVWGMPDGQRAVSFPWRRWACVPVCAAVCLSISTTAWPLRARFRLSHAEFERALSMVQTTSSRPASVPRRIGMFHVTLVFRYSDGGVFFQTGVAGMDSVGFAYRPTDTPARRNRLRLAPFWFTEKW